MAVRDRKIQVVDEAQGPAEAKAINLKASIEAARAAQAALAEHDALRARASELDGLLAEQRQQQAEASANDRLEAVRSETRQQLEAVKSDVVAWRERFDALTKEAAALVEELPKLQHTIYGAGRRLAAVAAQAHEVREPWQRPDRPEDTEKGIPMMLQDVGDFSTEWDRAGGRDPALACFPEALAPGGLAYKLAHLIQQGGRVVVYAPNRGARAFRQ